jgi:hypothetical protein
MQARVRGLLQGSLVSATYPGGLGTLNFCSQAENGGGVSTALLLTKIVLETGAAAAGAARRDAARTRMAVDRRTPRVIGARGLQLSY